MLLTEYDEAAHLRHVREEGREEGRKEGRKEQREKDEEEFAKRTLNMIIGLMKAYSLSAEDAMAAMNIPDSDKEKYLEALSARE